MNGVGDPKKPILVVTTTDQHELALKIARQLITQRQAACVQVEGPFDSLYRWQGKLECATEWRCSIKTTAARFAGVQRTIRELHTYEEPEIVVFPIAGGSATYLQWLQQQVRS